jgi:predicted lipid-binding transport protein (Tim44 family)
MAAAQELPAFDPRIIERYVETTYRKATAIFVGSVTAGVMIGAVFGATPLTSLGSAWPIPKIFGFATMLSGAFIGGLIGYIVGDTRAFICRLQGQTALAQVETAMNSRRALEQLEAIEAVTRRLRTAPARPSAPAEVRPSSAAAAEPAEPPVAVPLPQLRLAGSQDVPPPPLSPTPVQ